MQCRLLLRVLGNNRGGAIILQGSPVVARTPETPLNNPFLKKTFYGHNMKLQCAT
jgi:hypothetical protein